MQFFDLGGTKESENREFQFFFRKNKEERAYVKDSFELATKTRDNFMYLSSFLFFFFDYSRDRLVFALFKLVLSLAFWTLLRKRMKSPIRTRILLELWLLIEILTMAPGSIGKCALLKGFGIGLVYSTFSHWGINIIIVILNHLVLAYFFMETKEISDIFFDCIAILLLDLKLRAFWLNLMQEKRKNLAITYIMNQTSSFFLLLDHNLRVLSLNQKAQVFFPPELTVKRKTLGSFSSLLQAKDLERLETAILEKRMNSDTRAEYRFEIEISEQNSKEIDETQYVSEEKLGAFLTKLQALQPVPAASEISLEKTPNISAANFDRLVLKESPSKKIDSIPTEKTEVLPVKMQVFPMMLGRKVTYFLSMHSERRICNFIEKIGEIFLEFHEKSVDRLYVLEQDYIKWHNMQGLNAIKENDLKNLGYLIHDLNFNLSFVYSHYLILLPRRPIVKDFHIISLMTYILEVISMKAMTYNHELTLIFEPSFPDVVNGQFFALKYTLLNILSLMINEFEFPKHSKFKVSGKLKEFSSVGNDTHFKITIEMEYPHYQAFSEYIKLLLLSPELADPIFFLSSNPKRVPTIKTSGVYLQALIRNLGGCVTFREREESEVLILEAGFKTVDLSTFISSPAKSLTLSANTLISKKQDKKASIPNLNLSFCRTVHKKTLIVWKVKPAVTMAKSKANVFSSIQKKMELNESLKRKISIRGKDESPTARFKSDEKILGFEVNQDFSLSQKVSCRKDSSENLKKSMPTPLNQIPESLNPICHSKAKSLDFTVVEPQEPKKSNSTSGIFHNKSHFSHYELEKSKNTIFGAELENELEKVVLLQKPKMRRFIKKSLLMILKSRIGVNKKEDGEKPKQDRANLAEKLNLKLDTSYFGDSNQQHQDSNKSKSAFLPSSPITEFSVQNQHLTGKTFTSGKRTFEGERTPVSPTFKTLKKSARDVSKQEVPENEASFSALILPFPTLNTESSTDIGFNFLFIRKLTHQRHWLLDRNRPSIQKSLNNFPPRMKKSPKFLVLIIDDNINHFKTYQNISYIPGVLIEYSENFTRGMEIFLKTFDQGRLYDLLILGLGGKTQEGFNFVKEIRAIEGINRISEGDRLWIGGILDKGEEGKVAEFKKVGVNEVCVGEIDDEKIKKFMGTTLRGKEMNLI